ncbi:LytTR family DNA-binding domain-containing protein [Aquimarina sp. Aq107]|uniref:LytR/AlgR family response regulator transcription factor n=1 Tax=Aquimarina sp. Aq107 TaxID=1191912 RepID=UPI00131EDEDE|nr:LytTR family DNA-binding domain-containing protein [Aquimarina sp. Aq107]
MSLSSSLIHENLIKTNSSIVLLIIYASVHLINIVIFLKTFTNLFLFKKEEFSFNSEYNSKIKNDETIKENLNNRITLVGKSNNDNLILNINKIYFIKSSDNYCEIKYLKDGKINTNLFRVSISDLEKQIKSEFVIRAHKSYLVNLLHISDIKGNVNNTKATLIICNTKIPISRSRREMVIKKFKTIT